MSVAVYPFSAIVGQEAMKRALILAAIDPGLGGVLIRGSKGAAKSTAVRALAAILPDVEVYENDPFSRAVGEEIAGWPLPEHARIVKRPVTIVDLPVGATDDRVVGSLNLESALTSGRRHFEPGLLASAHRGILYIDEVNLLGDHLVDLLLDAAAMGVNHVEREGLAFRHPSRFVLVGTMNPEEGDLRPQLLDRFGLAVDVAPMNDPSQRAEVVRRRLAFENQHEAFLARWSEADRREGERIARAQSLLPSVVVPDSVLDALCSLCAREGAEGLRADLTIYKAASALAAYEGRTGVTLDDVASVSEFALSHRRTSPPRGPAPTPPVLDDTPKPERPAPPDTRPFLAGGERPASATSLASLSPDAPGDRAGGAEEESRPISANDPVVATQWTPRIVSARTLEETGRRRKPSVADRHGVAIGSTVPSGRIHDPAIAATLRAAAPCQVSRGRSDGGRVIVRLGDVRVKVRKRPARHLVLFVVDASRSMGARERMRQTKSAVLSLLVDAYQKRDRVGLVSFGRGGARLVLPPTRSVRVAARFLEDMPIGGATPLAAGLEMAARVVAAERRRDGGILPLIVLLTDGRGNLPLHPGSDPEADAIEAARRLRREGITGLVLDTESGPVRLAMAPRLAEAWGAECRSLDDLDGPRLPDAVRKALFVS
ncbi:MAG: Mg-chelatase subunit ChlI [Planctomycetota bacterium]|nr:Mg-chelatase subunit ChlI [Planctomycetota bacterium]